VSTVTDVRAALSSTRPESTATNVQGYKIKGISSACNVQQQGQAQGLRPSEHPHMHICHTDPMSHVTCRLAQGRQQYHHRFLTRKTLCAKCGGRISPFPSATRTATAHFPSELALAVRLEVPAATEVQEEGRAMLVCHIYGTRTDRV
jgi:hypothetical protein